MDTSLLLPIPEISIHIVDTTFHLSIPALSIYLVDSTLEKITFDIYTWKTNLWYISTWKTNQWYLHPEKQIYDIYPPVETNLWYISMRRLDLSGRRDDASLGSELNCLDISSLSSSRSLQAYTFRNQHIYISNKMLHATFEKKKNWMNVIFLKTRLFILTVLFSLFLNALRFLTNKKGWSLNSILFHKYTFYFNPVFWK